MSSYACQHLEVPHSCAVIDNGYRYSLTRRWHPGGATALFVMLNPSVADGTYDDATVRRCLGFARRWGCHRLTIGNLFAARTTDPSLLGIMSDPVGPHNDDALRELVDQATLTVVAWSGARIARARVISLLPYLGRPLYCLRTTMNGSPRHPLYVRNNTEPVEWYP